MTVPAVRRRFGAPGPWILLVVLALVVAYLAWASQLRTPGPDAGPTVPSFSTTTVPLETTTGPSGSPIVTPAPGATKDDGDVSRLAQLVAEQSADGVVIGVTAVNMTTRQQVVVGIPDTDTAASIAKVDIVAMLLLQRQDAKQRLTDDEMEDARLAIQESNNEAADRLLELVGDEETVKRLNRRLGLVDTVIPGNAWIDMHTTLKDQVALLDAISNPLSPLDARRRGFLHTLMRGVQEDQAWGVGQVGVDPTVKNGWVHLEDDWEKWSLNSVGTALDKDGDRIHVVVLTSGFVDVDAGIAAVTELARAAFEAASTR